MKSIQAIMAGVSCADRSCQLRYPIASNWSPCLQLLVHELREHCWVSIIIWHWLSQVSFHQSPWPVPFQLRWTLLSTWHRRGKADLWDHYKHSLKQLAWRPRWPCTGGQRGHEKQGSCSWSSSPSWAAHGSPTKAVVRRIQRRALARLWHPPA